MVKIVGFWFVFRFSSLSQKVIHSITIESQTEVLSSYAKFFYEGDNTSQHFVVQWLTRVCLFVTPWMAAHQASLSLTVSWSLLKFMSIESVMLSNYLILWLRLFLYPQSFPASGSFAMSWLFASGGQHIGVSASAPVFSMNIQS